MYNVTTIGIVISMVLLSPLLLNQETHAKPVVFGADFDCSKGLNTLKAIKNTGLLFLGGGDYWYQTKKSCVETFANVLKSISPKYMIIGNHEFDVKSLAKLYEQISGISKSAYWKVTVDGTLYIGTNVYNKFDVGSNQYKKVEQWLSGYHGKRIVVLVHTPPFAPDATEAGGGHNPNNKFRKAYEPLFQKYGVDLVLSGDDHIFAVEDTAGTDYVICGIGGKGGDTLSSPKPFDYAAIGPKGFCTFEFLNDDLIKLQQMDSNGQLVRAFNLN